MNKNIIIGMIKKKQWYLIMVEMDEINERKGGWIEKSLSREHKRWKY